MCMLAKYSAAFLPWKLLFLWKEAELGKTFSSRRSKKTFTEIQKSLQKNPFLLKISACVYLCVCDIATLGSILDSQPIRTLGFSACTNPAAHPPTQPPATYVRKAWILCGVPTLVWRSDQIPSNGMCGVPPLLLKRTLRNVPTHVWTSDAKCIGMFGVPPTNFHTSYQFSCQSSSPCILECGTPS